MHLWSLVLASAFRRSSNITTIVSLRPTRPKGDYGRNITTEFAGAFMLRSDFQGIEKCRLV